MAETDEQLRERHPKWVNLNAKAFAVDAPRAYKESGRGGYVATATPGPPKMVPLEYWTQVEDLPDTDDGRYIARMIREYDPANQFVVIVREPDYGVHAYRVGITQT